MVISSGADSCGAMPPLGRCWLQLGMSLQLVVDLDLQCDGKGFLIDVHVASMVIVV
jgi:hypothetical protein